MAKFLQGAHGASKTCVESAPLVILNQIVVPHSRKAQTGGLAMTTGAHVWIVGKQQPVLTVWEPPCKADFVAIVV